jgi:tyrosine-protein phosphatase YwqE
MCRIASADGITHMVATPHANERFSFDRAQHEATLQQLRERVGDAPELSLGCDFHLSYDSLQDVLAAPERYTINASRYLLVELSDFSIPTQVADCFFAIRGSRRYSHHYAPRAVTPFSARIPNAWSSGPNWVAPFKSRPMPSQDFGVRAWPV